MNIIFAGTPDFSVAALQALLASEHHVCAVYTQPDRPAGRGRKLKAGPVKQVAAANGLPVRQPKSLKAPEEQEVMAAFGADLMVVVAYGLILPQAVLDIPRFGCLNIHASLLPRWRGAAPIQRAILAGDTHSGVTIMQMDQGLDTGDMLLKKTCAITPETSTQHLHDQLAVLGAQALMTVLAQVVGQTLQPQRQNDDDSTYAKKLDKQEAVIDWTQPAQRIAGAVNAFNPWPVAQTRLADKVIRIWAAHALAIAHTETPGALQVVDKRTLHVATGEGVLSLQRLQLPGGKPISVQDFLNGHDVRGQRFQADT